MHATDIHLTNVAVQKTGEDYDDRTGGKWDIHSLRLYMMTKYGVEKANLMFKNIQDVILRSLLSAQQVVINDKHSFEL